jgi:ankyrin repeat protein
MESNNTHQTAQASTPLNRFRSKQDDINLFKAQRRAEPIDLHQAVRQGSGLNQVQALIKSGANLDSRDRHGNTLLHTAAWYGSSDVAIFLINKGVALEARNNYGHTPLHAAVQNGHFEIVEQLVNKGVDVDARDNRGNTPLHLITQNYFSLPRVKLIVGKLLERKANLEAKNNDGYTVLQLAAQHGYINLIDFLVASGDDLMVRDVEGNTLLHLAVLESRAELAGHLVSLNRDLLEAKNGEGNTALHLAVLNSDVELIDPLLKLGADLEVKDGSGDTPLCFATWFADLDIVKHLVEQGADLEARDGVGNTPLHIAVLNDNFVIAKYLVEQGADLEARDGAGSIPLHIAILNNNLAFINYLTERFAITRERRDIESVSKPISPLVENDHARNEADRSRFWVNGVAGFFKEMPPLAFSSSNVSLAGPTIDTLPSNSNDVNIGRVDTNATLLFSDFIARKLMGKKYPSNNFFEENAHANLEAGNRIIDAIESFPPKLDSMEKTQGFNRTFTFK